MQKGWRRCRARPSPGFARGEYDRGVGERARSPRLIGLPIINGAEGQHMQTPPFPRPLSRPACSRGFADAAYPHLVPRITLADGAVLMPLAFFKDVRVTRRGAVTEVRWRQGGLDRMGGNDARPDRRASIETHYILAPGRITRSDRLRLAPGVRAARIDLEFASFSGAPSIRAGEVTFGERRGAWVCRDGIDGCTAGKAESPEYRGPGVGFATVVRCAKTAPSGGAGTIALTWELSYNR
ncbi:hypothetical protein DdX_22038 [Ditylenchus destructor]|uniref:Uncharacterized protein n=1 Tax=Ditylenchus destructor TaxID=166010 RepID=A0AAD4ME51_9BILA|nr:hypothetical protein DdX_22038 [Ditylenchus destructor]